MTHAAAIAGTEAGDGHFRSREGQSGSVELTFLPLLPDKEIDRYDLDILQQVVNVPMEALLFSQVSRDASLKTVQGAPRVKIVAGGEPESPQAAYLYLSGAGEPEMKLIGSRDCAHWVRLQVS